MGFNLNPISGIIESVGGVVTGVGKVFFGDKSQRDQQASDEIMSVQQGYVSENLAPEKTSLFGQFVDGMNRMVRPFFTYGIVAMFIWCVVDPIAFAASMNALRLVPEMMWYIMGSIIVFWFGSRTLMDKAVANRIAFPTEQEVANVLNQQKQFEELRKAQEQDKFLAKVQNTPELPAQDNVEIQNWIDRFKV